MRQLRRLSVTHLNSLVLQEPKMSTSPITGGLTTGSINQASALADGQQSTKEVVAASLLRRDEGLQQYLTDKMDRNTALQKS
ncbi:hypothetical protein [Bordetella genomosp. 13]|uniref:Uncharacterized protein n=1 Tax=Bordetella genomosp. 13 TaxID=463040 RepID=A0A1W6ZE32_9BORD|nr:hypothetical protein [Bordetella genomosp. 13]ARP95567.1 hypothetical protein CAL15_14955 [Bordetella genomosp. 13]